MANAPIQRNKIPALAKLAFRLQVFLLRHNLMGPAGDQIMVITTRGRKSGRLHSTPIAFVRDGNAIMALNYKGWSDWYKNALNAGQAEIMIRGKTLQVRAEAVHDPAEKERIFEIYRRERAGSFRQIFRVPVDAPPEELQKSMAEREFIRFTPAS